MANGARTGPRPAGETFPKAPPPKAWTVVLARAEGVPDDDGRLVVESVPAENPRRAVLVLLERLARDGESVQDAARAYLDVAVFPGELADEAEGPYLVADIQAGRV